MLKFKKEWLKILGVESEDQISTISQRQWRLISGRKNLPLDFIEYFADKVEWEWISIRQNLTEQFIRKFDDKLSWVWLSEYQSLSEAFIEENADKVVWEKIFIFQILSPEFIEKHADKNLENFSRPDIIFRDILPLNPCREGVQRFLGIFKKDQLVTWNELLKKYHFVTENKNSYFSDIEWFVDEILF